VADIQSFNWKNQMKSLGMLLSLLVLAGCGGGDDGGSSSGAVSDTSGATANSYSLSIPVKLGAYPPIGLASKSVLNFTDYGMGTLTFAEETSGWNKFYAMTTKPELWEPGAHLSDVNSSQAWQDGWTGNGVSISVIDDFSPATSPETFVTEPVRRTKAGSPLAADAYTADYDLIYTASYNFVHGESVANITGGNALTGIKTSSLTLGLESDSGVVADTCVMKTSTSGNTCAASFYERNYELSVEKQTATLTKRITPGVAAEALVVQNNLDLSYTQDPIKTVSDIQGHLNNSASTDIINLSLGADIPTSGQTFASVMAEVVRLPLLKKINSVMTVAAGNGGAPCATDDLAGCNAIAVALAFQNETKASTIVVGALAGSGSQENIAIYSTRAGILADRFILAQGDIGMFDIKGTSFAAPRVAGVAAILKQKYPSLTPQQIADVILLSANKDINNDGVPDFSGVHAIYGHGKLDLVRALALAGAI